MFVLYVGCVIVLQIKTMLQPLWWIFGTRCVDLTATVTHSESPNTTTAEWVCSEAENSAMVATVKRLGLISRRGDEEVFI